MSHEDMSGIEAFSQMLLWDSKDAALDEQELAEMLLKHDGIHHASSLLVDDQQEFLETPEFLGGLPSGPLTSRELVLSMHAGFLPKFVLHEALDIGKRLNPQGAGYAASYWSRKYRRGVCTHHVGVICFLHKHEETPQEVSIGFGHHVLVRVFFLERDADKWPSLEDQAKAHQNYALGKQTLIVDED